MPVPPQPAARASGTTTAARPRRRMRPMVAEAAKADLKPGVWEARYWARDVRAERRRRAGDLRRVPEARPSGLPEPHGPGGRVQVAGARGRGPLPRPRRDP